MKHRKTMLSLMVAAVFGVLGAGDVWAQTATDLTCTACVGTTDLAGGAVATSKLKANAVTGAKVKDESLTGADILDGSIGSTDLTSGAVGSAQISDGSVSSADVWFTYAGSGTKGGAASDALLLGGQPSSFFAPTGHSHDDRYFTEGELSVSGTINTPTNPVDWTKLKGVPAGLADGTDADTTYGAGTGLQLTGSLFSIAVGGVGAAQINSAEVQRRVTAFCAPGSSISAVNADGTVTCEADDVGSLGWSLNGNAGTNPATQFLGTTDNTALELRGNGQRALRLEPADTTLGTSLNLIGGAGTNSVSAGVFGATIAGGGASSGTGCAGLACSNRVTDQFGTVGGGAGNQAGNANADLSDGAFSTVA